MTVFWWRMVLVPVMLLFSPRTPAGLDSPNLETYSRSRSSYLESRYNLGLRQPGRVFGCLWWAWPWAGPCGERGPGLARPGQPGTAPFIFLRGRYL